VISGRRSESWATNCWHDIRLWWLRSKITPRRTCKQRAGGDARPFNFLYWGFLLEHKAMLRSNPRLGRNVLGLRYLDEDERRAVRRQALAFLDGLDYSGS
jgi:deoxyribodipyrimidine photolyase-like uncharacterized protein